MADLFKGGLGAFDVIVLAIVVVSAIMSLGRGLIREASSVFAFLVGGAAAIAANTFLAPVLEPFIPDTWSKLSAPIICVVIGFFVAYALAAFIGGRLSKLIHSNPEIGLLDRLGGAAFGVIRGLLAMILFVLLMEQVLSNQSIPRMVADSYSYRYLSSAADVVRKTLPGFVTLASDRLKDTAPKAQPKAATPKAPKNAKPAQ